jgi:hypothetical protein
MLMFGKKGPPENINQTHNGTIEKAQRGNEKGPERP